MIVLAPQSDIPPELATVTAAVQWPLPDREEIGAVLDACIARLPDSIKDAAAPNGARDAAIAASIKLPNASASPRSIATIAQWSRSMRSLPSFVPGRANGRRLAKLKAIWCFDGS